MFPHHFHIVKRKKNKSACFLPARKILPAGQKKKGGIKGAAICLALALGEPRKAN